MSGSESVSGSGSVSGAKPRRDVTLDVLRVIGIAAVVVAHVWWMTDWAHAYIFSWNMLLFFFLTGYLWKDRPFSTMVKRRSEMLLVPYAFWLVVWSVIVVVVTGQYTVRFIAGQVMGGRYMADKPFWAFWFSTALFVLVVAYWAVSKLPLWAQWIVAVILIIPAYVAPDLVRMVPLAAATGLACMVFLLAGRTVRRFEGLVPLVPRVIAGAVLAILSFVVFGTGLADPVDIKIVDFGTPVVSVVLAIAIVMGGMWVLRGAITALRLHSAPTLSLLAESTFMVILTHAGILWAIDPLELALVLQFAIALAIPWSAALVVRHTRASRMLTGMPRQPVSRSRIAASAPTDA